MSFKKNTAVPGFTVGLISATDGSDITTGTPAAYVTLDGGTQTAIAGALTHEGNGQWSFNLTAAEMNGDIVGVTVTHTSAITVQHTIKTVVKTTDDLQDLTAAQVNAECDTAITDASLATAAALATVDGIVDSILVDTGTDVPATLAVIDGLIDAIKAKTDSLTFTSGTDLDCNIQKINDAAITGNGQTGTEFSV